MFLRPKRYRDDFVMEDKYPECPAQCKRREMCSRKFLSEVSK
jgi:hypothetical protein